MYAAALRLEIRIPEARSLKDKRRIVKGLMGSLAGAFPVAVSEVGFQDQWQRATLGAALVAPQAGQLERIIHSVQHALRERPDIELLEVGISYLEER
ncbi:MAG: hypothetical protein A2V75_01640 [Actinobacteria bacterium RBG_16_70_17]|nr:MAG: hypothetical protein A2V75_01640 [Actinobacteria bacterium RBG_16_70_17]